jgi:short-subunit dehydrogenase
MVSSPRRVLITGASSGLGREMAVQLGRQGCRLALTGRRERKLLEAANAAEKAGGRVLPLLGSVSDMDTVRRHYLEIKKAWGGLDWAILNAGVGDSKSAREFSSENFRWTFAANVFGVTNWLEAVLPDMVAARRGTVAAVSSLAGFRGLPKSGSYSSSKAAIITLMESTRQDLRGTGVRVVTVCPGFVRSELTDRNDARDMWFLMDTAEGARRVLRGVERGERLVLFPWQLAWPMFYVVRVLPPWLYDLLIGSFAKRHPKKPYVDESL